jgi:hypothetical protein
MVGCKKCGRCCKQTRFTSICGEEDWVRIYKHLERLGELFLIIQGRYDDPIQGIKANEVKLFDIEGLDTLEKVKRVAHGALFWILDEHYCPFRRQERGEKGRFTDRWYCELHGTGAKPEACLRFPLSRKHAKEYCECPYYED